MKYFWITLLAIFAGIFDNSFLNMGSTNIFLGTTVLLILFAKRNSDLAILFAFIYGLVFDFYIRGNLGITSLILIAFVWVWFELRNIIKINPSIQNMIFSGIFICLLLIVLKLKFFNFDMGKTLTQIDLMFLIVILVYSVLFNLFFDTNKAFGKTSGKFARK